MIFNKVLLAVSFFAASLSFSEEALVSVTCTPMWQDDGDTFIKMTFQNTSDGKVLKYISMESKDGTKKAVTATDIKATDLRPGIAELGDLASSGLVEYVLNSSPNLQYPEPVARQFTDISVVGMPSSDPKNPLEMPALILGIKADAGAERQGLLASISCEADKK